MVYYSIFDGHEKLQFCESVCFVTYFLSQATKKTLLSKLSVLETDNAIILENIDIDVRTFTVWKVHVICLFIVSETRSFT